MARNLSQFPTLLCLALSPCFVSGQEVRRLPAPAGLLEGPTFIEEIEAPSQAAAPTPTEVDLELTPTAGPEGRWYYPSYWFGPTPWDTGFEFGLNGASGNSNALSTRIGGYVKRETKRHRIDASLYHNRTKTDGDETQNNALLDVRHDWLLSDTRWSLFLMNQTFYDEFQAFDVNVNINSGLGYQLVDCDLLKFGVSLGAGATREFGGRRTEWAPEAQAGLKWEQNISDTQKFYAKLDYFPEWQNYNRYRLMSDIGWEVELSRPSNVSLKFSLTDRYDSQPDGVSPNNTNYSVLLLWKK